MWIMNSERKGNGSLHEAGMNGVKWMIEGNDDDDGEYKDGEKENETYQSQ